MITERDVRKLIYWTRDWFDKNGPESPAVIGISGGKDSTVAAMILVKALGRDRTVGVLMPDTLQIDIQDAMDVVEALQIPHTVADIGPITAAFHQVIEECTYQASINVPPRIRMTVLYAIAQSLKGGGRVINTCNKSEDFVGYSTKYGDAAGDVSLLSDFLVSEVIEIGMILCKEFNIPEKLINKPPADGLTGRSDEEVLGFTYDDIEKFIKGEHLDPFIEHAIYNKHIANLHKLEPIPAFRRE